MANQRLKGQEVSIRVLDAGVLVDSIEAVASFSDSVKLQTKEDGFLGEPVNRFDEILDGYSGNFEFQNTRATWNELVTSIEQRAKRQTPDRIFNVVRTDFYPNGDSTVYLYRDVKWGEIPTDVASRGDFVKTRMQFVTSERTISNNALP